MIEKIVHFNRLTAILLRASYHDSGINFFTPDEYSQQLGYMNRPRGYVIKPHLHNSVPRQVEYTNEVLFIKSGKVRVDFYDDQKNYLESRILLTGDVVLLAFGGHGFEMLEDSQIIEVKQGPYAGDKDKTHFESIASDKIKLSQSGGEL